MGNGYYILMYGDRRWGRVAPYYFVYSVLFNGGIANLMPYGVFKETLYVDLFWIYVDSAFIFENENKVLTQF